MLNNQSTSFIENIKSNENSGVIDPREDFFSRYNAYINESNEEFDIQTED